MSFVGLLVAFPCACGSFHFSGTVAVGRRHSLESVRSCTVAHLQRATTALSQVLAREAANETYGFVARREPTEVWRGYPRTRIASILGHLVVLLSYVR